ncbi:MAG: class I SAM-dependent DNA methyltransferase [Gallionella sp.]|nr:class I SAM-dependent DNA methyltransferase [Gallionella sp.]
MPLSWNEIRSRAVEFSKRWENETSEDAEAKAFWTEFLNVFGIDRKRVASFEEPVKKLGNKQGYIDLFWKGELLVEHKSRGKDLDKAYIQALDYFPGIKERELPKYVLVSDFARFRLYDLEDGEQHEFALRDLHKNIKCFGFIAGYQTRPIQPEDPVNIKAAELMGKLHDALKDIGYEGHALEHYLVRLLFCLFAEDTGIFERQQFQEFISNKTAGDGGDLAAHLAQLFEVLNTPQARRLKNLDEQLADFAYVNGKLFAEHLPSASFDTRMRNQLLDCCALDWSRVSPAIFGSLFQSVMDDKLRRNLGAHYTSEANILKLIKPLFLDELRSEFEACRGNAKKLTEFHEKLSKLKFFDPACGCGNFLIIAYRELRLLELDLLRELYKKRETGFLDISEIVWLDVDQFYGIEIEEFPAQIAQVAMWLTDHQMNQLISEEFGNYFARLPLKKSATIACGNALSLDWRDVAPDVNYILGNPPFIGSKMLDDGQRREMEQIFHGVKGAGVLDYVAAWYLKAAQYMASESSSPFKGEAGRGMGENCTPTLPHPRPNPPLEGEGTKIRTAFVSTNSITQGEQVGILWGELLNKYHIKLHFAHRTFKWSNAARGKAAVHCVIIGFAPFDVSDKCIWDYEKPDSDAQEIKVGNINPYLIDALDVLLEKRGKPICIIVEMSKGSQPTDGGYLLLNSEQKQQLLAVEPKAAVWIRPFMGADEFINGIERWCLWLKDCPPNELRSMPEVVQRVEGVKKMRLASKKAATREWSSRPTLFTEDRQPEADYLIVPSVSSERRNFIPIGFMPPEVVASNLCLTIPNATLYHFGILTSTMHMAWVRYTCGRLKSDYRYSAGIVYNNFPWPETPSMPPRKLSPLSGGEQSSGSSPDKGRPGGVKVAAIEAAAQAVLDARAQFMLPSPSGRGAGGEGEHVSTANSASLADLYDPLTMPPALVKAHQALDRAVDACYRKAAFTSDAQRVEFLFERYQQLTSLLPVLATKAKRIQKVTK